jgi:hypothetical protein
VGFVLPPFTDGKLPPQCDLWFRVAPLPASKCGRKSASLSRFKAGGQLRAIVYPCNFFRGLNSAGCDLRQSLMFRMARNWLSISLMVAGFHRLVLTAVLAAIIFIASGCALLAGGATGVGVGALAGSTMDTPGGSAAVGGAGGAAGGALVGAAVGNPLVGAVAGGLGGATTGYLVKKNSASE